MGHVRVDDGGERRAIDGAYARIAKADGWTPAFPEHTLPVWRTSGGSVEIPCLVAGDYTVSITADGYSAVEERVFVANERLTTFDVVLLPDERWIHGEVLSTRGVGLESVEVTATSGQESRHAVTGLGGGLRCRPSFRR